MQIQTFLKHWGLVDNPFRAEEARDDPIFRKIIEEDATHPDFAKIFGEPDRPSAAVVFGEKGSGKTALRLMMEERIRHHNNEYSDRMAWIVRYDDLNPILDRFAQKMRHRRESDLHLLQRFRLADHMDAILSLATTRLVDHLLGEADDLPMPPEPGKAARRINRQRRLDLAELVALYDDPRSDEPLQRWHRLKRLLRLNPINWLKVAKWGGAVFLLVALGLAGAIWLTGNNETNLVVALGLTGAAAVLLLAFWGWRHLQLWRLARRIHQEVHVVGRTTGQLRQMLGDLPSRKLASQPIPQAGDQDSRYQLLSRFMGILDAFGYTAMIVLVDRVDEPAMINGDAEKMRAVIWPVFNNKFLQQDNLGVKLLLPVELRHLLRREDAAFFQKARLDKQHMIDRLVWSGTTLYDLCSRRLQVCQAPDAESITLTDLFEEEVSSQDLIDALDQMHQPRDAFKFLYQVIQEHCASTPHDQPVWRIPRLTLEQVRKQQSQRVQDLYRGLTPT